MFEAPTKACRVFISRKTSDQGISKRIRKDLEKWAPTLEFFDATSIEPGANWRKTIREELNNANVFFLLLTKPAKDDFDWPLYEAGLFESLDEADRRRVICIYAATGGGPPDQLGDKQAVGATETEILDLLLRLFHDKEFSLTTEPLNEKLTGEDLRPIAQSIANDISGVKSDSVARRRHVNPYIQLHLPPGVDSLVPDIAVESDQVSLKQLFGLMEKKPGQQWTWGEIIDRIHPGFNLNWAEQLGEAVEAMRTEQDVRQLTGRFLANDGKLFRPEIEIYRTFEDDGMTIDVTFSEQIHLSWIRDIGPPVALAATLALASRVQHELIEPYARRLDDVAPGMWYDDPFREGLLAELGRLVKRIEHDGYFIGRLAEDQLQKAFKDEERREYNEVCREYYKQIKASVREALEENDLTKLQKALQRWGDNNLRFLKLGLHRYKTMLDE